MSKQPYIQISETGEQCFYTPSGKKIPSIVESIVVQDVEDMLMGRVRACLTILVHFHNSKDIGLTSRHLVVYGEEIELLSWEQSGEPSLMELKVTLYVNSGKYEA